MSWFFDSDNENELIRVRSELSKLKERVAYFENCNPIRPTVTTRSQRPTCGRIKLHEDGTWTLNGKVIR